jgi:hypothetical protein
MSYNYGKLKGTADSLIAKFGKDVVINRQAQGAYDPLQGTYETTTQTIQAKAVQETYSLTNIDNELIKQGDVKLLIDTEVFLNEVITIQGVNYTVTHVEPLSPAETLMFTTIYVRR